MRHPLIRLATASAALFTLANVAIPTAAQADQRTPDSTVESADAQRMDHKPEPLRLGCHVRQTDEVSGVACRWSIPTSDQAVGVRLLRITVGSDLGRQVIFRTADLSINQHADVPVRPGQRYVYAVQAVNSGGRVVATSRAVTVGVPPIDVPEVEVLRLTCAASTGSADVGGESEGRKRVGCEWTLPQEAGARVMTLWRSVDGAARERVASFAWPFASSYRDTVPAETTRVAYAVIGTNGDGDIVARSRAEHLRFRDVVPPTTVPPISVSPVPVRPKPTTIDPVPTRPSTVPPTTVPPTTVPPTTVPPTRVDRVSAPPTAVPPTDAGATLDEPVVVADADRARPQRVRPDRATGDRTQRIVPDLTGEGRQD